MTQKSELLKENEEDEVEELTQDSETEDWEKDVRDSDLKVNQDFEDTLFEQRRKNLGK